MIIDNVKEEKDLVRNSQTDINQAEILSTKIAEKDIKDKEQIKGNIKDIEDTKDKAPSDKDIEDTKDKAPSDIDIEDTKDKATNKSNKETKKDEILKEKGYKDTKETKSLKIEHFENEYGRGLILSYGGTLNITPKSKFQDTSKIEEILIRNNELETLFESLSYLPRKGKLGDKEQQKAKEQRKLTTDIKYAYVISDYMQGKKIKDMTKIAYPYNKKGNKRTLTRQAILKILHITSETDIMNRMLPIYNNTKGKGKRGTDIITCSETEFVEWCRKRMKKLNKENAKE